MAARIKALPLPLLTTIRIIETLARSRGASEAERICSGDVARRSASTDAGLGLAGQEGCVVM
jgi:hypothetical protein